MPIGEPFFKLDVIDSTNNYAMAQVQAHLAEHGMAWFAHRQTAGKGQRGKAWISGTNENIILSVAIQPGGLILHQQFIMSALVAVACRDFVDKHTNGDTTVKWPNDIYWKDRKAGGILIENQVQGSEWKFAIVGIGININQVGFPGEVGRAVSLRQVTGKTYDVVDLAKALCLHIEQRFTQVSDGDIEGVLMEYHRHLYKLNEKVTFRKDNTIFTARVTGISANGELLINMGQPDSIPIGEVEWVFN